MFTVEPLNKGHFSHFVLLIEKLSISGRLNSTTMYSAIKNVQRLFCTGLYSMEAHCITLLIFAFTV